MKKLFLLLAFVASTTSVQAAVTAPNVSIQSGGNVSVIWRAPSTQTAKVSVFVPGNASAINALYHVYPKGKSSNSTTCLSTDVTHPCFEIAVNQALHKNSWVQLTVNKDVNTQWPFVKNVGFVTVASNNLSATEKLGVAGMNFFGTELSTKQISTEWTRAIASVFGIKKAINQCLKDHGGMATGFCDAAGSGYYESTTLLGKYGITKVGLFRMNIVSGTEVLRFISAIDSLDGGVSIDLTERTPGKLGGCSFHLVPTLYYDSGAGVVWLVLAKAESAPAVSDLDCVKFVKGSLAKDSTYLFSWGAGGYGFEKVFRTKWAKAIASVSGIKKAITQCLKDHGGIATGFCDAAGNDTSTLLAKYGITDSGLVSMNTAPGVEIQRSISTMYGADANSMVSIDLTETSPGTLGGCSFHLVPTRHGDAGAGVVWQVLAIAESAPAANDLGCVRLVKGSLESTTALSSGGGNYAFEKVFRTKWAKAIAAVSGIKKAITQCLKDSQGVATNLCDSAGIDTNSTLGRYGILQTGLDAMNYSSPMLETQIGISNYLDKVSIDITETTAGRLGGCAFHLIPTLIPGTGGVIIWHVAAEYKTDPAMSDTDCIRFVKGSEALSSIM